MAFRIGRYTGIEEQTFNCEVVTPLFLGGANPKEAELRPASIKGMLRFWWRAVYGSDDLKEMRESEAKIFGDTDSCSHLRVIAPYEEVSKIENIKGGKKYTAKSSRGSFNLNIIDYLAFGICVYNREARGNVYERAHIPPGTKIPITLRYPKEYQEQVIRSFEAFIRFGGLGAKSRNGFGSLHCASIGKTKFNDLFKGIKPKSFTAFSEKCKMFTFGDEDTWQNALSDAGLAYRDARLSLENKHVFESRAHVAMPIIARGEKNIPGYAQKERHSKSYFLHVTKTNNGKYRGQIFFMPYKYYKEDRSNLYNEVCAQMNKRLKEASKQGGQK